MRQVIPLSLAIWILISTGDYILNNNPLSRLTNIDIFNVLYNAALPILLAIILTIHYRKPDYLWWIPLPLFSGIEDIICITTDWLSNYPPINNFIWLHNQPLIEAYRNLFGHPTITMGTLFLGVLFSLAICILLTHFCILLTYIKKSRNMAL